MTCSAVTGAGLPEIWALLEQHEHVLRESGELERRRRDQQVSWMWSLVRDQLIDRLRDDPKLGAMAPELESEVRSGALSAGLAAERLVSAFLPGPR